MLYHPRNPLLALDRIWEVWARSLIVESHVIDNAYLAPDGRMVPLEALAPGQSGALLMQLYPGGALLGDPTNVWGPTGACLAATVQQAVFDVWHMEVHGSRCVVAATRSDDPDRVRWRESDSGLLR